MIRNSDSVTNTDVASERLRLFLIRAVIFLSIPLIVNVVWALYQPNVFNYRVYEAITPFYMSLRGAFYPNYSITKTVVGDLGHRTSYAVERDVTWITDRYGFRFDETNQFSDVYDIVLVGDSMSMGSGLTQEDTLASVMSEMLNTTVYPFASPNTDISDFLNHPLSSPLPSTIVFQVIERNITASSCPQNISHNPQPIASYQLSPFWTNVIVHTDIILRHPTYLYFYAQGLNQDIDPIVSDDTQMIFRQETLASQNVDNVPNIITSLLRCQAWFAENGTEFIFLPVPDKETIYFDDIPLEYQPTNTSRADRAEFLQTLIDNGQSQGLNILDTLSAFDDARDDDVVVYQLDDTHWSVEGIHIATELIRNHLESVTR